VRIDKNDPQKEYSDFWDWLLDDWHVAFVLSLAVGYLYYLVTTTQVLP
jgi:hypothetical protein